jgi:hypothetical protein
MKIDDRSAMGIYELSIVAQWGCFPCKKVIIAAAAATLVKNNPDLEIFASQDSIVIQHWPLKNCLKKWCLSWDTVCLCVHKANKNLYDPGPSSSFLFVPHLSGSC